MFGAVSALRCKSCVAARAMAFRRVSTQPLAFVFRGFASAEECESLIRAGEAARAFWRSYTSVHGIQSVRTAQFSSIAEYGNGKLYAKLDRSSSSTLDLVDRFDAAAASLMGLDAAKGESQLHCTPAWPDDEAALLNGLHVDTYNEPRRCATSLLYLRSVERGGETRFASHPAGAALLERGVESTIDAAGSEVLASELEAAGRALVQPERGTLLLFFTRGADGATDPSAFHGSARPLSCDKWTLQTFWAAPAAKDAGEYARARVRSASELGG